ncbi:MAG: BatD family protein [Bacteroidales bacterium]|nr:BatD family protein [Bacteroidales bacterium]
MKIKINIGKFISFRMQNLISLPGLQAGIIRPLSLVIFCFVLLGTTVTAQDIQLTASAKGVVGIGETFNLSYMLNAQGTGFRGPAIQGFDILSGPNTSTTSSIRAINGRTTMSITYTYSYLLRATREGTFEIPAASATVDHRTFTSNTVTIKVVKNGSSGGASSSGGGRNQGNGNGQQQESTVSANDVYVKAFASNANPMQGEGIVVTYKIFTKVPIAQVNIRKLSSFSGFWSQNLMKENEKLQQTTQMINGERYVVADIRKIALFPLKSGHLVIDPLELECVAQIRKQTKNRTGDPFFDDFFNDSFFNSGIANVEKNIKSNPLVINVQPLPEVGKPTDFSGAVGNFTFRSEIDKTRLKTNEAVTLKCVISGQGNIQLIDKVNVAFPPDFETYDPKVTSDVQTSGSGISGSQTFEYLLIPRKPGNFTIKPITFSYFDLSKKRYVSITSPSFMLLVEKGSGDATAQVTYTGANKEDIKYIGSDIRHIKDKPFGLNATGDHFFLSIFFWLLLLIPLLLFGLFLFLWNKFVARRSDTVLMKNLKATKVARKRLRKAEDFWKAGQQEAFYEEISQALWGYLSDKFSIPLADLSIDSVQQALEHKNVNELIIKQFVDTLNDTEFARFAPGEKTVNMERIYDEALEIISKIERELR